MKEDATTTCDGFVPHERKAHVMLPCAAFELVPVDDVEFLDVQENIFGEDTLHFTCPRCGKTHESVVLG
jgi:hypothetical protein